MVKNLIDQGGDKETLAIQEPGLVKNKDLPTICELYFALDFVLDFVLSEPPHVFRLTPG